MCFRGINVPRWPQIFFQMLGSKFRKGNKDAAVATLILSFGFVLITRAGNTPPTIGAIPDQSVIEDQPTDACLLNLNDAETPVPYLQLTGASSDPEVVPPKTSSSAWPVGTGT